MFRRGWWQPGGWSRGRGQWDSRPGPCCRTSPTTAPAPPSQTRSNNVNRFLQMSKEKIISVAFLAKCSTFIYLLIIAVGEISEVSPHLEAVRGLNNYTNTRSLAHLQSPLHLSCLHSLIVADNCPSHLNNQKKYFHLLNKPWNLIVGRLAPLKSMSAHQTIFNILDVTSGLLICFYSAYLSLENSNSVGKEFSFFQYYCCVR